MSNKWMLPIVVLIIVGLISLAAFAAFANMNSQDSSVNKDKVAQDNNSNMPDVSDDQMPEGKDNSDNSTDNSDSMKGTYTTYDDAKFAAASDKTRIIFFYANWCPSCREHDANLEASIDQIPSGVAIFKTDFDSSISLRQKYGVTIQHTFVEVDKNGNEIQQWNSLYTDYDLNSILERI